MADRSRTHDSYRHEALLWRGLTEFLAATVPFIQEGLAAGEPVMAALVPQRAAALQDALSADAA